MSAAFGREPAGAGHLSLGVLSVHLGIDIFSLLVRSFRPRARPGGRPRGSARSTSYSRLLTVRSRWDRRRALHTTFKSLANQQPPIITDSLGFVITASLGITGGRHLLMWVGEQITESGSANGVSS